MFLRKFYNKRQKVGGDDPNRSTELVEAPISNPNFNMTPGLAA